MSAAAAGVETLSASRRFCSPDTSETTERKLRPTHLIKPYAIPSNASASAAYLKLTGTVAWSWGQEQRITGLELSAACGSHG